MPPAYSAPSTPSPVVKTAGESPFAPGSRNRGSQEPARSASAVGGSLAQASLPPEPSIQARSVEQQAAATNGRLMSRKNYFFFNDTATTEIYTLSLHDALPI